ncbi:YciI family protein [Lutibacter sp. TH_r2]|uniref:YciI family protein n=1 Tax=Lutibacter sp. TH_r2 TaxID=3082083 RepID=UPI0029553502|nr:YciI family protein [Lutibacter sp. TH_r2]MDV7187238.1 YciI family protein [Lutibacter sp. TH_r2]
MKKLTYLLLFITILLSCKSEIPKEKISENIEIQQQKFDEDLAKKYGADDYGMKKYVIAFLKRGPNRNQDSITKANLQRKHMANINKLAKEGKLVLAGPFLGNDNLRGIYIFDVESIEEAKKLTETDPAIKAGSLEMELKEWYGSAALMAINKLHKKIAKIEI